VILEVKRVKTMNRRWVESAETPFFRHSAKIQPTAIIEADVIIGHGTAVWDAVHIRKGVVIGPDCIIGEKTYIAYDVKIGRGVKINSFVYICSGVTIEDQVMISAGNIFTNDLLPRAFDIDGRSIKTSKPTEETLKTIVRRGATIGAGCKIGPGLELGEYCMIGMGSVLTRDVVPYQLVYGNPAKPKGYVCICGQILTKFDNWQAPANSQLTCSTCQRKYMQETSGIILKDH
jgi:acetyltransferase-like isoleucine patch superfamily enzyme